MHFEREWALSNNGVGTHTVCCNQSTTSMCMERQIDISSINKRALQLIRELSNILIALENFPVALDSSLIVLKSSSIELESSPIQLESSLF